MKHQRNDSDIYGTFRSDIPLPKYEDDSEIIGTVETKNCIIRPYDPENPPKYYDHNDSKRIKFKPDSHSDETIKKQLEKLSKENQPEYKTGAKREKLDQPRYFMMPARIVNEAYARVAEFGAKKYDVRNWEKGLPQTQIMDSLERHLWAYRDGEDLDRESGLSHVDHILWNAVALAYNVYHKIQDDRVPALRQY